MTLSPTKLVAIQSLLQERGLSGWLLYDFRDLNPIARRLAPASHGMLTRRWAYWIPAQGNRPGWSTPSNADIQPPPERVETYSSWQSFETALLRLTGGLAHRLRIPPGLRHPLHFLRGRRYRRATPRPGLRPCTPPPT